MHIHDGEGSGNTVGITERHRMKVVSISATPEHYINHQQGQAYNLLFQITPNPDDPSSYNDEGICCLYIKNTSTLDLVIEEFDYRLGGESQVEILEFLANDGETPIGGSSITPINLNLGSGNIASGTFLAGSNITGMEQGDPMIRLYIESSHTTRTYNFAQDLIIPRNNTLTIWAKYGGNEIDGTIIFNYASAENT